MAIDLTIGSSSVIGRCKDPMAWSTRMYILLPQVHSDDLNGCTINRVVHPCQHSVLIFTESRYFTRNSSL